MRLLSSPRLRRRLAWMLAPLVLAGGIAALVVVAGGSPPLYSASDQKLTPQRARPSGPKPRRLTPADRRRIDATLDRFVSGAVARRNAARAYTAVTRTLRSGISRRAWNRGATGVYPFPARGHRFHGWKLDGSTSAGAWLELLLQPRKGAKVGPILFDVQLRRRGHRWLVNSFIPAATFAPVGGPAKVRSVRDYSPAMQSSEAPSEPGGKSRLSSLYAAVPFAVFGALLAGLVTWFVLVKWRDRRIEREYRSSRRLTIAGDDARAGAAHRP